MKPAQKKEKGPKWYAGRSHAPQNWGGRKEGKKEDQLPPLSPREKRRGKIFLRRKNVTDAKRPWPQGGRKDRQIVDTT